LERPLAQIGERIEGARSEDDRILGTYLHGLFDTPQALNLVLRWAGLHDALPLDVAAQREAALDRLADTLEEHLDLRRVFSMLDLEFA